MVALIFMHLRDSSRLTYVVVLAALFWLGIMIVLSMSDYLTRGVLTYG
jgi:cytochrome c oxidase subunit 4